MIFVEMNQRARLCEASGKAEASLPRERLEVRRRRTPLLRRAGTAKDGGDAEHPPDGRLEPAEPRHRLRKAQEIVWRAQLEPQLAKHPLHELSRAVMPEHLGDLVQRERVKLAR